MNFENSDSGRESIYITGPTGVGKSAFATSLALQLGGEVIGADAFQIYQDLPILTAQPSKEQQRLVPHHLIGRLPLSESCDAGRYRTMALTAVNEVKQRHHIPIVAGGTGLYVRSLIAPLDPLPTGNAVLRESFTHLSPEELLARLAQLDPKAADFIDTKNRRRIERALEIVMESGSSLSEVWKKKKESLPHALGFFLFREREELYQRIESNIKNMFEQGAVEEVAALGLISPTASMALGLREIQAYLRREHSLQTTIEKITQATKRYAKRQLTWFKNQHTFLPLNLSHFSSMEEAVDEALLILQKVTQTISVH